MALHPCDDALQLVNERRGEHEGKSQPQHEADQQGHAPRNAARRCGQAESGSQKSAHTGAPTYGEGHTERERRRKPSTRHGGLAARGAFEQFDVQYPQVVEAKDHDQQAAGDIQHASPTHQKCANRSGKGAKRNEHDPKACDKGCCTCEGVCRVVRTLPCPARKEREVDRQKREQARGDEGDDSLKEGGQIVHVTPTVRAHHA